MSVKHGTTTINHINHYGTTINACKHEATLVFSETPSSDYSWKTISVSGTTGKFVDTEGYYTATGTLTLDSRIYRNVWIWEGSYYPYGTTSQASITITGCSKAGTAVSPTWKINWRIKSTGKSALVTGTIHYYGNGSNNSQGQL